MNNPFIEVRVLPAYGTLKARVSWKVKPGFTRGTFCVSKSPDGINNWQPIGTVDGRTYFFCDDNLLSRGRWDEAYYRVTLKFNEQEFTSEVISTFGVLTREEFAISREIMNQEWLSLRRFIPIKVYKMRSDGPRCPRCVDPDTDQRLAISLCPTCFGTGFDKGFYDAIDSFMHIGTVSPKIRDDSLEGAGATDPIVIKVRTIAYPNLEKEDMIVNPAADKRYIVATVDYGLFNGKVPVYSELQLEFLDRRDIRYTFPL